MTDLSCFSLLSLTHEIVDIYALVTDLDMDVISLERNLSSLRLSSAEPLYKLEQSLDPGTVEEHYFKQFLGVLDVRMLQ